MFYFPKFLNAREGLLFDGVVKSAVLASLVSVTDVSIELASLSSTFAKVSFCVVVEDDDAISMETSVIETNEVNTALLTTPSKSKPSRASKSLGK
jgi:hypothetical protein